MNNWFSLDWFTVTIKIKLHHGPTEGGDTNNSPLYWSYSKDFV
jgi:hypothetical protein